MKSTSIVLALTALILLSGAGRAYAGDLCPQPPDPPLNCPPTDGCHDWGQCDPETGQCTNPVLPDGSFCSDGNVCTFSDACQAGICVGSPWPCNDNNPCTDDACTPESGCTYTPNANPCDDGDSCTVGEQCTGGQCGGATPLDCEDHNACTSDYCFPGSGCYHFGSPGQACDDASLCTTGDVCDPNPGTTCTGTPVNCDDGNDCTLDSCAAGTGCTHAPQPNQPCSDGDACTSADLCDAAGTTCTAGPPVVCTALDVCHIAGTCDPQSGCSNPTLADGTPCADSDACDGAETCQSGVCRPAFGPNCDDNNPCTNDTCDPGTGCSHAAVPDGTTCDDLDACDGLELCQASACISGTPLGCGDGNVCTEDLCAPIKREMRSYTEHTAASEASTQNPFIMVAPAGGLIVYIASHEEPGHDPDTNQDYTAHIQVLKFAVDPERVAWITETGGPRAIAPGESFELTRTVARGGGPYFGPFLMPAAAHDLGNGRTRVIVPYQQGEGGCTFINQLGGPECVKPPAPVFDLNGDSDPFDSMLAYAEIVIDRPTKTILEVRQVLTNTEASGVTLATNGRFIAHLNPEAGDGHCIFPGGGRFGYCFYPGTRADRNGDGTFTSVLSLHDVGNSQTVHTLLKGETWDIDELSLKMGGDLLAFRSRERSGVDYNGDLDSGDTALRYTSVSRLFTQPALMPSVGPVSESTSTINIDVTGAEGNLLTYITNVLRVFDTATGGDVSMGSYFGYASSGYQLAGGIQAQSVNEQGDEVVGEPPTGDYNGDGDEQDIQLRFYEHATRTLVMTNITLQDNNHPDLTTRRSDGVSDGEIIAYAAIPSHYTVPSSLEVRFIRVSPCVGAPCDEAEHCSNPDAFNGTPCGDGEACNGNEVCQSGACQGGTPVECNDFNSCTNDTCSEGTCQFTGHAGACDDANPCTVGDSCGSGFCQGIPISAPPEVQGVLAPDTVTLTWSPAPASAGYQVVRGALAALPAGPGGDDEVCFLGVSSPSLTDPFRPPTATGVWYLVRGENSCGVGGWGTQSNGMPRSTSTCP